MGKDHLTKEEVGELMDQQVHMMTTMQEIRHITRKYVRVDGDYLGDEGTLIQAMATWPHHIEKFKWKYDKAFAGNPFFGADLFYRIHKWVQVLLHL